MAEYVWSHPTGRNPPPCKIKRGLERYASEIAKPLLEQNTQVLLKLKLSIAYRAGNRGSPPAVMKALWDLAHHLDDQGGRLALDAAGGCEDIVLTGSLC